MRLNFSYVKIIRFFHPLYLLKIIGDILKNVQKQVRLFTWGYMIYSFHATDLFWYPPENIRKPLVFWCFQGYQKRSVAWNGLMTMKMRLRIKIDQIDTTNIPRPRHRHQYANYKMYLIAMIVICIKQCLNNIWSSIHEKVKEQWGWVKKKKSVL